MERETWLWKIMLEMRDAPAQDCLGLTRRGGECFNSAVRFMPSLGPHETQRPYV